MSSHGLWCSLLLPLLVLASALRSLASGGRSGTIWIWHSPRAKSCLDLRDWLLPSRRSSDSAGNFNPIDKIQEDYSPATKRTSQLARQMMVVMPNP